MLYHFFELLDDAYNLPGAGLFRFITFRAGMALVLALLFTTIFGKRIIARLQKMQMSEAQRNLGLDGAQAKAKTPSMGGVIILMGILLPCLLMAKLDNVYVQLLMLSAVWMSIIGFIDDYIKIFKNNKAGLKGKFKILGQVGLGITIAATMLLNKDVVIRTDYNYAVAQEFKIIEDVKLYDSDGKMQHYAYVKTLLTDVPFLKGEGFSYDQIASAIFGAHGKDLVWIIFLPFAIFVVVAVSNAANLTDGLDGLLAGLSAIIGVALGIFAYVSGNVILADYLNVLFIPYSSEIVIYMASFIGACIGFLWYNSFPAKIFMGDTGSLMIGGVIAAVALLLRKELLLPILCGIFFIEALSVIIQVGYFKYTKKKYGEGKRVFKMAPIHHHFQKLGLHEVTIVNRFWIVGIFLAVIAVITLKIR